MENYEETVSVLAEELSRVENAFRGLSASDWATSTKLVPVDPELPHWTVFELAGHFDIAIGLTNMLIDGRDDSQPARDRTSFFINPRSETGPVVYGYAYTMVEGKTPEQMPDVLAGTFSKVIEGCRSVSADTVGPGYFAPMRVDEFAASRIVEAVVHGLDLTLALDRETIASPEAIAVTAAILDDLLARRTRGQRPADLSDDLAWILAASGRAAHSDNRLPLIG
jgi:Mycothiol maleylpyruvate isomerase N-terminal domain